MEGIIHCYGYYLSPNFETLKEPRNRPQVINSASEAWRAGTITLFYAIPSPHRLFKNSSTAKEGEFACVCVWGGGVCTTFLLLPHPISLFIPVVIQQGRRRLCNGLPFNPKSEQLISNSERYIPAFAKRDKNQTLIDL
jgi:hypothetical protein